MTMPAHPKAYERITRTLRTLSFKRRHVRTQHDYTVIMAAIDQYLDEYIDMTHCATEWDADKWGFNGDTWMKEDRELMSKVPMNKGWDGRWYVPR